MVVTVVITAVVVVAGVAALYLWPTDDGGAAAQQDSLPKNANLDALPFPDVDALGFGDGAEAMCDSVNELMSGRGYQPVDTKGGDTKASCWYITTGLSLLEDGSNSLNADITVWRGDAESRYQEYLDKSTRQTEKQKENPDYRLSKVEQFPAGDAGFVSHQESVSPGSERTDTTAFFRSGDDLMMIAVWGYVQRVEESGEDKPNEPLSAEITYGEITDIVRLLSDTGTPGEPRISEPDLKEHPTLAALKESTPPTDGPAEQACAAFTSVAEKLGTRPKSVNTEATGGASGYSCTFEPPEEPEEWPADYSEREIGIRVLTFKEEESFRAAETMGRDLLGLRRNTATDDVEPSPLYELPIGDGGYALYHVPGYGYVSAAFLVDGRTYVHIEISGWTAAGGGVNPLSEDVLMQDLTTLLTGV